MARCIDIVSDGAAVNRENATSGLARASALITVRRDGHIVAVGAIKRARASYVATVAKKSGHALGPDAEELGYVAVDPAHRGQHLSSRIVDALREKAGARLFATTDDPKMKTALAHGGFHEEGGTWQGDRGELSLWITTKATEPKSE
jgi:GNAT superfamily N-acetyltransferase